MAAYLNHLESVGFSGAQRYLGPDEQGRDVLTYIDGTVPGNRSSRGRPPMQCCPASAGWFARGTTPAPAGFAEARPELARALG